MNHFQQFPIEKLECNPFTKIGKEWALVTAGPEGNVNTMTISWGGMGVLWGKNVVYVFIRDSRFTKELVDREECFSLTFFEEKYRKELSYCGSHSGRTEDKFANSGLTVNQKNNIPFIDEGNLVFLCRKLAATRITADSFIASDLKDTWYSDGDMHTMYVAEILEVLSK